VTVSLRQYEISKQGMGFQRGAFKSVFNAAQRILRSILGMELVELPPPMTPLSIPREPGQVAGQKRGPASD